MRYRFKETRTVSTWVTPGWPCHLQALVEKIHTSWPIDRDYMAPLRQGELVALDPALLVTPPEGLETGYVPIATQQTASEATPDASTGT
jgi:hypothetical protein